MDEVEKQIAKDMVNDIKSLRTRIEGRFKSREVSIVLTKLDEARLWFKEAIGE